MDNMYSINQICEKLGVARRTVHHWITTGRLRAFHLGGKRLTRVWAADLERFVRTGRSRGRSRKSK